MAERNHDWNQMLSQAHRYPDGLDTVEARLRRRLHRRRRRRAGSGLAAAAVLCLFVLLVNTSPAFASAVCDLPLIGQLANLVRFDKSLRGAVENDYVQTVGLTAEDRGCVLQIPYVIADEKNLVLFVKTPEQSPWNEPGRKLELSVDSIRSSETGEDLEGFGYETVYTDAATLEDTDGLAVWRFYFLDSPTPRELLLSVRMSVLDDTGLQELEDRHFQFTLSLNPFASAKTYELQKQLYALGQIFTVKRLILYPTTTEVVIGYPEDNSSLIKGLDLAVTENGQDVLRQGDGITASYDEEAGEIHLFLESNYFDPDASRQLSIRGLQLIPKDEEFITVDLFSRSMSPEPEGILLEECTVGEQSAYLTFRCVSGNQRGYSLFSSAYKDTFGDEYFIDSMSYETRGEHQEFSFTVAVPNDGKIILQRGLTAPTPLPDPIAIDLPTFYSQP